MNFAQKIFNHQIQIPVDTEIIFVADLFKEDYVGGAELTTDALIKSSPNKIFKLHSKDLTQDLIQQGFKKYWIFGNFAQIDYNLLPIIGNNLKYSVLEYDYKFCKYRSPEKHLDIEKKQCNCHKEMIGKIISEFYSDADAIFWMSEKQKEKYLTLFPILNKTKNIVLSSVFDNDFFEKIEKLNLDSKNKQRKGWIVLGSNSWVKGFSQAENWCKERNKQYEVVWNLSYDDLLTKLSLAEGFVYLPVGSDTCPRMVIEAKLLGCKVKINENVQHTLEGWYDTAELNTTVQYLRSASSKFWNYLTSFLHPETTISGYLTTYNCVAQKYPFEQCIKSLNNFCDEIVIVDGGSTDQTLEKLAQIKYSNMSEESIQLFLPLLIEEQFPDNFRTFESNKHIKILVNKKDWNHPRSAIFDGEQKALARSLCTKLFCWQIDSDEIVHENDVQKIKTLIKDFPKKIHGICLPVIEFWGGYDKVRADINPWKWRLSRNLKNITHGVPSNFRRFDKEGNLFSAPGSDGCDMIDSQTYESINFANFYSKEAHNARIATLQNIQGAKEYYENWFNQVIENLPSVYHYSWFDLERKIKTYRDFWTRHWCVIAGEDYVDTKESNMMFDLPWSQVTDDMIKERALELSKIGGWIWHSKYDGTKTPWITIKSSPPCIMKNYVA